MTAIDSLYPVETPDGIELSLHVVGPVPRGIAWGVDLLIRGGIMIGLIMALAWLEALGMALLVLIWFLINWWYPVLFEVLSRGATPGKKAVGIKVIHQDGTPIGWSASIIRNLLRQIDFLPFLYATGLVAMFCNSRFQRLGDLAGGSVVVYRESGAGAPELLAPGPVEAPPVALDAAEQRALLSFAERVRRINPKRAAELAGELSPLTGRQGEDGVDRVLAWSRFIAGHRS
ncbi:MAG: RDD family protein [Gammaproteobacteria bacterium]|jgi:uncharacterized RDD family membrane protein YckC|nr:RDD family protein [Gammaproteobacteria bacterium]